MQCQDQVGREGVGGIVGGNRKNPVKVLITPVW